MKYILELIEKKLNKSINWQIFQNSKILTVCLVICSLIIGFQIVPATVRAEVITKVVKSQAQQFFDNGVEETQNGNYQKAISNFTKTIELEPKWTIAYSNRCLAHIYLENYQKAEQDCTQVLSSQPNNTQAYLNRGLSYYRLGQLQAALFDYNSVIKLQPDSAEAYYNRGLVYAAQNNYNEAIADYSEALSQISPLDPIQLATIYNDRGLAYWQMKNIDLAIADFHQSISLDSKQPWAYFNLAWLYYQQEKFNDAVTYFTHSLNRHPHYAEAYINRGLALYQLGYHQAALADLHFGCECFCQQGKNAAYQTTLNLIQKLKKNLSTFNNIIV